MEHGVMVAQQNLGLFVMVRVRVFQQQAVDVPQVTCKSLSLAYWRQAHEYLCVLRGHFKKIMNENEIQFCYIANHQHGLAKITQSQYNQILNILYGEENV